MRRQLQVWVMIFLLVLMTIPIDVQPLTISFAANSTNTGPALAFDDDNNRYLMAYTLINGSNEGSIQGQFLSSSGVTIGEAFDISDEIAQGTGAPEIVYDDVQNQFVVVWQDNRSGTYEVYCSILDDDGNVVEEDFVLSDGADHKMTPGIAMSTLNSAFVVMWLESGNTEDIEKSLNGVFVNRDDLSTEALDLTKKNDALSFDITFDSAANRYVVVWDSQLGKRTRLNVEYISSDGAPEQGVTYVSPGDGEVKAPSVAYSDTAEENLVVWIDESGDEDSIYSHYATTSGSAINVMSVEEDVDITGVTLIDGGSSEELLLVWSEYDGEAYSVVGNYINNDGTATGQANIVISSGSTTPVDTVITFNPNSDTFLVMQDDGSGEPTPATESGGVIGDEDAEIEFRTSTSVIDESGQISVIVERSRSTGTASVEYSTITGTATETDFIQSSGVLNFIEGVSELTIEIPIVEDATDEDDEYFDIQLSNVQGDALLGSTITHTVTIQDNDAPHGVFNFLVTTESTFEGESVTLTIERSEGQNGLVTVDYKTLTQSASASDYTVDQGTLTFSNGQKSQTITLSTIEDLITEDTETFQVQLSNATNGASLGTNNLATIEIYDDDELTEAIAFATDAISVLEGDVVNLDIKRTGLLDGAVSATYSFLAGSADESDYVKTSGTLNFAQGESIQTIQIQTIEDSVIENSEVFTVRLEGAETPAYIGTVSKSDITILNDDSAVQFESATASVIEGQSVSIQILRQGDLSKSAQVDLSAGVGTANSADYVEISGTLRFEVGQSVQNIEIQTTADSDVEDTESIELILENPVNTNLNTANTMRVSIIDDDSPPDVIAFSTDSVSVQEGASQSLKLVRKGELAGTISVNIDVNLLTALESDYSVSGTSLTFEPGMSEQSVVLSAIDDIILEDSESLSISLGDITGNGAAGQLDEVQVTLLDNDISIEIASGDILVTEGNSISVRLTRSGDISQEASIEYSLLSNTAGTEDFVAGSGTVVFNAGQSEAYVTIETTEDFEAEDLETFSMVIGSPSENVQIGDDSSVRFTIVDDDITETTFSFVVDAATVAEGSDIQILVTRTGDLSESASVEYKLVSGTAGEADYTVSTGTLLFQPGSDEAYIIVQTKEDAMVEDVETLSIVLENPSGGGAIGAVGTQALSITDNDTEIYFSSSIGSVVESGTIELVVKREGDLTSAAQVEYVIEAISADASDYANTSGTIHFEAGQSTAAISVQTTEDSLVENSETFEVTLQNPSTGVNLGETSSVTLTLIDNDTQYDTFNFAVSKKALEEGGRYNILVLRAGELTGEATVSYTVLSATASSEDYTLDQGALTFLDGESEKYITIQLLDDVILENSESVVIQLKNPTGTALIGSSDTFEMVIEDDDVQVTLATTTKTASEGDAISITLYRSGQLDKAVEVGYVVTTGTADTSDYTETGGTVYFQSGESVQTIIIQSVDDSVYEATESFTVSIVESDEIIILGEANVTVTLEDNDASGTKVSFSTSTITLEEGESGQIKVIRQGEMDGVVQVAYSMLSVTAEDNDYVNTNGIIVFDDQVSEAYLEIKTVDDDIEEETEKFTVQLGETSENVVLGKINELHVSLQDNDLELNTISFSEGSVAINEGDTLTLNLEREGNTESVAQVEYLIVSGTADESDYGQNSGILIFEADVSEVTLDIGITTDVLAENTEYFYVILHNPSDGMAVGEIATVVVSIQNVIRTSESSSGSSGSKTESKSESDSDRDKVKLVQSLTEVLRTRAGAGSVLSEQTARAYFLHLDTTIESISGQSELREALKTYADTMDVYVNEQEETEWVEAQIIDRIKTFAKTSIMLEDHEDLTEVFLQKIREIEASDINDFSYRVDRAIEDMVNVTLRDVGTIRDAYRVETNEIGVKVIHFDNETVKEQLLVEMQAYDSLNEVIQTYYGADNVRNFDLSVTLDVPRTSDKMEIVIDKDILATVKASTTEKLGVNVGGFVFEMDQDTFRTEFDDISTFVLQLNFEENDFVSADAISYESGYIVDVECLVDGQVMTRFETPIKLSFALSAFQFDPQVYNPDKLSVLRRSTESDDWKAVGGMYDAYAETLSVYRQNLSQYTVMQTNKTFSDIEDSEAKADIEALLGKGIIDETASFDPNSNITREELATWVARSYGLEDSETDLPFEDISPDHEHYEELAAAYSSGIFSGSSDKTFNPEGQVTKQEMAVMLSNAMVQYDQKQLNSTATGELALYLDEESIDDWAKDEIALLSELGIIEGENGELNPDETITKQAAAEMIKNIFG